EISKCLFHRPARKKDSKLFSAVSVRLASAGDVGKLGGDHAQRLVACLVPIGIVKFLEVIHVQHGDGVGISQLLQGFIQGASAGKPSEFIVVGHAIGGFQHGNG